MSNTNQNKILITGASGYLGKNLCKHFYNQGYYVIAQTRDTQNQELKEISHEQVVLDAIWTIKIDYLVHNLSLTKYFGDWNHFKEINIDLSKKLFIHFENIRSAYISSISVFGYGNNQQFITEATPRLSLKKGALDHYSRSKIIVEDYIAANQLNVSIVRPGLIYGNRTKSENKMYTTVNATVPLVEVNALCRAIEQALLGTEPLVVNAVDEVAYKRMEYEKDNKNLIVIPEMVTTIAKLFFWWKPSVLHRLRMTSRKNRFDNSYYKKILNNAH